MNDRYIVKPILDIRMLKRIQWDIDSPRFKEAQLSLGYKDEDLILRPKTLFEDSENQIAKFKYQHHLTRLRCNLNEIVEERNRIINKEDIQCNPSFIN